MLDYSVKSTLKKLILDIISKIIVNMIVIILATKVFRGISVDNLFYTFLVSLLLILLNKSIKPFLKIIMLPLNIFTLGLTYPIVNIIILKLISLLLGTHFIVEGWFGTFFISIFISFMTIIFDGLIGRNIRKV